MNIPLHVKIGCIIIECICHMSVFLHPRFHGCYFFVPFIFIQAQGPSSALTAGLVGYWTFDEGSGFSASDNSGNQHTATLTNGPTWVSGKIGTGALSFDGVNDVAKMSNSGEFDFSFGSLSYGLWVYNLGTISDSDAPLDKGGTSASNPGYGITLGTGVWNAKLNDGTDSAIAQFSSSPLLNQWNHVFVVVDREAQKMRSYLNGQLTQEVSIASIDSLSSNKILSFGSRGGTSLMFNGYLDDARVYNRSLSLSEVQDLYTLGITSGQAVSGVCSSMVNSCVAGTFSDLIDSSGDELWSCVGLYGGTTASCAKSIISPLLTYTLTTSKSGTGTGTISGTGINCGSDCSETLTSGTQITLSATPTTGSTFTGWSGACSGTGVCTVTLDAVKTVVAGFGTSVVSDVIPPLISEIVVQKAAQQGVTILWKTNELATTFLEYGTSTVFGKNVLENTTLSFSHTVFINRLARNTTYYFKIQSRDQFGNWAASKSVSAVVPDRPSMVSNLRASAGSVILSWDNPVSTDFVDIRITRVEVGVPSSLVDLVVLSDMTVHTYKDITTSPGVTYV